MIIWKRLLKGQERGNKGAIAADVSLPKVGAAQQRQLALITAVRTSQVITEFQAKGRARNQASHDPTSRAVIITQAQRLPGQRGTPKCRIRKLYLDSIDGDSS